ncbi:hypothetical protein [Burkholderia cenocepacia]|uniref:hypothetical protein n=1 Tax=Burkholderia cenocepacia TaxID=95486 RepID=UPI001907F0FC|nr:hypothetical protein [Burkholderia cenocepacia]MBJ9698484.1 hypothetical protein [Burkholderia cenocepacia]
MAYAVGQRSHQHFEFKLDAIPEEYCVAFGRTVEQADRITRRGRNVMREGTGCSKEPFAGSDLRRENLEEGAAEP